MKRRTLFLDAGGLLLVAAVAAALAASMLLGYRAAPDLLWRDVYHDRNSHFAFGLDLALAVRDLDPVWFFSELEKAKVWPPLHGLALCLTLLLGGIDYRHAIVPSLAGWMATLVFSWLVAGRLFHDRVAGAAAGAVTLAFAAASPAFGLLASDVMLEALGAGLSAAALWAWLRASEVPASCGRWRLLAVILTALFFHKGNYWGLLVVSLALAALVQSPASAAARAAALLGRIDRAALRRVMLADPLLGAFLVAILAALFVFWRGPTAIVLWGRAVDLYPPGNLTTLAYALLFLRLALLWRRHRAAFDGALGVAGRALFYWHVVPVAISFLLPKRLTAFLWFVGPTNYAWAQPYDPWGGAALYWEAFARGFHLAPWLAVLALALALIGALRIRDYRRGGHAVFVVALVCFAAVILHPQHQGRFLASWIFAVWIAAGAGAAVLLDVLLKPWPGAAVRAAAAGASVALLVAVQTRLPPPPQAYQAAIRATSGPSDLALVRPALAALGDRRRVGVAATFGTTELFRWSFHHQCRCRVGIDAFRPTATSRMQTRAEMEVYLARLAADQLLLFDAPGSRYQLPALGWTYGTMVGMVDALATQSLFGRVASTPVPEHGATVSVWQRTALAHASSGAAP